MSKASTDYLLAGQAPELERLQLQSIVWEPAARELLTKLAPGTGSRAVDLGCGAMGWLRVLSTWVGDGGHVTGTDVDERMLPGAKDLVERERLRKITELDRLLEHAEAELTHPEAWGTTFTLIQVYATVA